MTWRTAASDSDSCSNATDVRDGSSVPADSGSRAGAAPSTGAVRDAGTVESGPLVPKRTMALQVYLPAVVSGFGFGASAPIFALKALELGASPGVAGVIVALNGLGMVLGDLPAGRAVARIGERLAILLGSVFGAGGLLLCILAPHLGALAAGMLLSGIANAVWGLARQSYIVAAVAPADRGKALSTFAGCMRLGMFVGPFAGAAVVGTLGLDGGLWLHCAAILVAAALMFTVPDIDTAGPAPVQRGVLGVVVEHRRLLATLGSAALLMGAARAAKQALLPLWAAHVGMSPAATSLVFGLAGAIDVLMSYPSGVWMDRFGRHAVGVPSMVMFALGYLAMPLLGGQLSVVVAALLLGFGNGLSNGVIMTVGADVSPPGQRAEFLGAWRLTHDVGMFSGPIVVGAISAVTALGAAAVALGGLGALGAAAMYRWVPRLNPGRGSKTVR